jgi:hypothetical protein
LDTRLALARPERTPSDVRARLFVDHTPVDVYEAQAYRMRWLDNICNLLHGGRYVSGAKLLLVQHDRSGVRRSAKKLKPEPLWHPLNLNEQRRRGAQAPGGCSEKLTLPSRHFAVGF